MHLKKRLVAGTVVAALVLGGTVVTAVASAKTRATSYYACLSSSGGVLYNVNMKSSPSCVGKDKTITWMETGPKGPVGPEGPKGPTGATGQQGLPGLTGAMGATGQQGAQGDTGEAGTGATVTTLDSGDANCPNGGLQVTDGDGDVSYACNGSDGAQGPQGVAGSPGTGATVAALASGNANCPNGGIQVTDGDGNVTYACNGADGAAGAQGPQGSPGPVGPQGATGPQGPAGTNATSLQAWDSADADLGTVIGDSEDVVEVETSTGYQVELEFNGTVGDPEYVYYTASSTCSSGPIWLNDGNDEVGDYMNPKQVFWTPQGFAVVSSTSSENPGVSGDFPGAYNAGNSPACEGGFPDQDSWPLTLVSNATVGLPSSIPTGTITLSTTKP